MNLNDKISSLKGVGPKKAEIFAQNNIRTLEDLLYMFPRKYEDRRNTTRIKDIQSGKDYLISGKILSRRYKASPYKKNSPLSLLVGDETGTVEVVFFNGRYIANLFNINGEYTFYGRVTENFDRFQMIHPEFFRAGDPNDIRGIIPVYPVMKGISQNEIRKLQIQLKPLYEQLEEWLPDELVKSNRLASPAYAIENIHFPKEGRQMKEAKFRLVFDELFTLESGLCYMKNDSRKDSGGIAIDTSAADEFINSLPFRLTSEQMKVWKEIEKDLSSDKVMNRLIQGDVGSGKTVIAQLCMFLCARSGYQSVIMAPTELLAKQHLASFREAFRILNINVELLCSSMKTREKTDVLNRLKSGEIDILVGTHAVIQPDVIFNNLGMVITDEQHRFGVNQRSILSQKGKNPNVMVMTATPIPRTLAVILYGDLDISQIREMPAGRKPVKTIVANGDNRNRVYDFVKQQLSRGKQAYIVAPLIEESDRIDAKSAEELYKELTDKLKGHNVALLHGALGQSEKDKIMDDFVKGNIHAIVSTVVIEVGINVPNATVMVIENSERFGLAQMHQLRGRVGRGGDQSYCFLICHNESKIAMERNEIMASTTDGFVIAEEDLKLRGPGEIFGTRQHGLPEMHISDLIRHGDVLEKAKNIAKELIDRDPNLSAPELAELKQRIKKMFGENIKIEL
ncbi:MAG: ATP-dependent DNA helicase RecG [Eubacteriaceae bacterium]|nr:ATP-dependent DNA helicase RecG [Eubacteriaceae bacterium]